MRSIFFDLETTGLNPCAQILNYSFITVDDNWEIESEHNGSIHISRLQLPNPYAILANRVDVESHQKEGNPSEAQAMLAIRKYIQEIVDTSREPVNLIGFNSNRFDVPFLRTSMIRNGVNPYFGQGIIYRDVLHAAQKLALSNPDFLDKIDTGRTDSDGNRKLSLRLAHLTDIFFGAVQLHESRDDVLLTIKLAKLLAEEFDIDIRTWSSYEVTKEKPGMVRLKEFPSFDAKHHRDDTDRFAQETLVCYESNKNYSLWISLERMKELQTKLAEDKDLEFGRAEVKDCVLWFNKRASSFYTTDESPTLSDEDSELVESAREIVSDWDIHLKNFWPPKNCDVECFIYDLSFDGMDAVGDAIQGGDLSYLKRLNEEHANTIYMRHFLNTTKNTDKPSVKKALEQYALYRYGSRMKVDKTDTESVFDENDPIMNDAFHESYNELMTVIEEKMKNGGADAQLMESLKKFYEESPMATEEVKAFHRIPF